MLLSDTDLAICQDLRLTGVFDDINPNQLPTAEGDVVLCCGDGDRFADIYLHHTNTMRYSRSCHHAVTVNGGALVIPPNSPIRYRPWEGNILDKAAGCFEDIAGGLDIKKVNVIAIFAHLPCGMAVRANLDIFDVLLLLIQAKDELRLKFPGRQVVCFIHIDYSDSKRRTYFLNRVKLIGWCQDHLDQGEGIIKYHNAV